MERVGRWVASHPRWVIGAIVLLSAACASLLPRIGYSADLGAMIPQGDPVIEALNQTAVDFSNESVLIILYAAEDVFRPEALAQVDRVAQQLATIPGVAGLVTPLNMPLVRASDWGIEIEPAASSVPRTAAEAATFRDRLFSSPQGRQVAAPDGQALALLVAVDPAYQGSSERYQGLIRRIEEVLTQAGEGQWYLAGDGYMGAYAERVIYRDLRVLLPLAALVVFLILLGAFRTPWGILLPLGSVSIAVLWTMGLMAFLGYEFTLVSMLIPIILMAMGSAAGIHVMNRFYEEVGRGLSQREAIELTMTEITRPVVMTALTTAAGFASLLTSYVQPIREFALFSAIGILFAMVVTLTFIPAVLVLRPVPARQQGGSLRSGLWARLVAPVARACARRPLAVVGAGVVVLVVSLVGVPRLEVETNLVSYFRPDSPVVRGTRLAEQFLGGTTPISVVIDTGVPDGVKEPEILRRLAALEADLAAMPEVSQPLSLAGVVAQVHQALNGDDPDAYRIPDSREAVAQELLLFDFAGGVSFDGLVSYDSQKPRLVARIANVGTADLARIIGQIEEAARARFAGTGIEPVVVGTAQVVLRLAEHFTGGQISSMSWAAGTVWAIVAVFLGSPLLALFCLIPLLLTVAVSFGVMGYGGVPLDMVTTMVASLAIGIGVDYSIHLVSRYRQELNRGVAKGEAMARTLAGTGRGVMVNALTLAAGFVVLLVSSLQATAILGWLLALTMVVSSVGALTVLAAVLGLLPEGWVRARWALPGRAVRGGTEGRVRRGGSAWR